MTHIKKEKRRQRVRKVLIGEATLKALNTDGVDAVEVFKREVRFIYQGLPTRPARYLLTSMRRPVVAEQVWKYGRGSMIKDNLPDVMVRAGLMMDMPPRKGSRAKAYVLTLKGLEVLKYWASMNRDFHAYFHAYMPYDVVDIIKIAVVDRVLERNRE